jgi:hypothetical protein
MAVALILERFVRPKPLVTVLDGYPAYAGALAGVIVGSVVALLTEDSGVVMPALMLTVGAMPALYLALGASPDRDSASATSHSENLAD